VRELESLVEPADVEPLALREEESALREGRQGLVGGDDHRVCSERERRPGKIGVEAEVRSPGLVDDERNA